MKPKIALTELVAATLYKARISLPALQHAGKLSVVTFHRVLPDAERATYPFRGLATSPEELDRLLRFFSEHFDCGTLSAQYARFLAREQAEKPLLALTFDDGQNDNFVNARPVLARHRMKASFFIPVRAIETGQLLWHDQMGFALQRLSETPRGLERASAELASAGIKRPPSKDMVPTAVRSAKAIPLNARLALVDALVAANGGYVPPSYARMMTPSELNILAAEGHEIGSHSMTHCLMPECSDAALEYETAESRRLLAEMIGQPVLSFCYPNGNSDERSAAAVARAGYQCAVTTAPGANSPHAPPFRLRRFDMDPARMSSASGDIADHAVAFRLMPCSSR